MALMGSPARDVAALRISGRWANHAIVALLLIALLVPAGVCAQQAGGVITGLVVDPQGLTVAGASVTVRGEGWAASASTTAAGRFRFANVPPGLSVLTVEHQGFAASALEVAVGIGGVREVTMTLALAGVTATASVDAVVRDRSEADASRTFAAAQLADLPTPRDLFSLARAVPGVLLDRVNVAGAESGQQPGLSSKGTRGFDTTWTVDGVVITDMAAAGTSPFYFDFDNVDEVRFTTAGQSLRQPTGGLGVEIVLPRGTNRWRGGARIDGASRGMEAANLPEDLRAIGVLPAQADHTERLLDAGAFAGGPLLTNRLWLHASYSAQDVRVVRGGLADRTELRNPSLKLTWRASNRDLLSGLYFDGDKRKEGRPPAGTATILFPAASALQNQHSAYAGGPHGLWKISDDHAFGAGLTGSVTAAYVNTGFELAPEGGMDVSSGRSVRLSRSFGSVNLVQNSRPQWSVSGDVTATARFLGADHSSQFGALWRRVDARTRTRWPGNGLLALDNSLTDRRVRVFREGNGTNRVESEGAFLQHSLQRGRFSLSGGARVDHQTGEALASSSAANPTLPALVPGTDFAGARLPFAWNTVSPRVAVSVTAGTRHPVVLRASLSRFAGQLPTAVPAVLNPATGVGFREFRWNDLNGDQLASLDEVLLDQQIQVGGGLNLQALNTPSPLSPNRLGTLVPPRTTSAVAGVDVDLMRSLTLQVRYTEERATGVFGVAQTRLGVGRNDYAPGPAVRGTLPDGRTYDVATWIPNPQAIAAGGGGFELGSWPGYASGYRGLEVALERRMTGWVGGRVSASLNDAVEHYSAAGRYDLFGNPTPTDTEPLVDGGPYAPQSGQMFLNARWQVDATGQFRLPRGIHLSTVVHARQGYPFMPFVPASLGADAVSVLLLPVDTYRYPALRLTDLRAARRFARGAASVTLGVDVLNLFNVNTALVRVRNAAAANYQQLTGYVTPRIARLSLRLGF